LPQGITGATADDARAYAVPGAQQHATLVDSELRLGLIRWGSDAQERGDSGKLVSSCAGKLVSSYSGNTPTTGPRATPASSTSGSLKTFARHDRGMCSCVTTSSRPSTSARTCGGVKGRRLTGRFTASATAQATAAPTARIGTSPAPSAPIGPHAGP